MSKIYRFSDLGKGNYGWLNANYHFSFANYYNHEKVQLGSLRVLNDDYISPNSGFDTHPHSNMEIVTYVVSGELTHQDSMKNKRTLGTYGVQYMSAGTGVLHSEFNNSDKPLHLYQMWILPNKKGVEPNYGDMNVENLMTRNEFTEIVSSTEGNAPIKIRQTASVSVGEFDSSTSLEVVIDEFKYGYLVIVEGEVVFGNEVLHTGDAIEINENINIDIKDNSHLLFIRVNDR
jgi:redox-sensitive bicupin YhaK (pirin superfamily)